MSRKSNLVRASLAACALSLVLSSTSRAGVLNIVHVQPAVLHVPIHLNGPGVKNPSIGEAEFKHKENNGRNNNGTLENHFKRNGDNGGNSNGSFGNCRGAGGGRWIC
jgi:hypothetical protein